jgi:hypothetical protein
MHLELREIQKARWNRSLAHGWTRMDADGRGWTPMKKTIE